MYNTITILDYLMKHIVSPFRPTMQGFCVLGGQKQLSPNRQVMVLWMIPLEAQQFVFL